MQTCSQLRVQPFVSLSHVGGISRRQAAACAARRDIGMNSWRQQHRVACLGDDAGGAGEAERPEPATAASAAGNAAEDDPEANLPRESTADNPFAAELARRTRRLRALGAYREQMQREDADVDVLECALLIAQHAHDLDGAACREEIESLARGVRETLPDHPVPPLRTVQAINKHLYGVHGFRGNTQDYYNPDNSAINKVLENRTGIPITLALLYMSVAERCGLPMVGINLPGHFMLAPAAEEVEVLVDAFNGGEICFLEDAAEKLAAIHGVQPGMVVIDPKVVRNKSKNKIPPKLFLARVLQNLKQVYLDRRDSTNTLAIIQYIRETLPSKTAEIRDLGLCMYALERYHECAEALREYLAAEPNASDKAEVESLLGRMRRLEEPPGDMPSA